MKADRTPTLYTIPVNRAFADALAAGVIAAQGREPSSLAHGLILLPNNRAIDAVQAAFVRASGGALLMPRLVAIGDGDLDESVGVALDGIGMDEELPPAIDPFQRQLMLADMLVKDYRDLSPGIDFDGAMAMRLAGGLARVIDQLHYEELPVDALATIAFDQDLAAHWELSLKHLQLLISAWPEKLAARGVIDLAERRNRLLARVARVWADAPPHGFVVAAGVSTAAPAIARLLRTVAAMPRGAVIFAGLDLAMPDAEWDALGDLTPPDDQMLRPRLLESHPQFHLKLLLHRMGVNRGEVMAWLGTSEYDGPQTRAPFASNLFVPAAFSARWNDLSPAEKAAPGVTTHIFEHAAEEAQGIALMLREALEVPGRTAALVTPDRALAARVAAALLRWGIGIDDSAGTALSQSPPGILAVQLAAALVEPTAPRLVALLAHPLVRAGDARRDWLDRVRALDRALRRPGVAPGWDGIAAFLAAQDAPPPLRAWWDALAAEMRPPALAFAGAAARPADLVSALRDGLVGLAGDAAWQGPAGRALADVLTRWGRYAADGPSIIDPGHFPAIVQDVMAATPVRKPFGDHPRLFIWGLLEARLQRADLMILGGLNEGSWPQAPSTDPWLAPGIRRVLGLAGPDRQLGLSAHDFAGALAAGEVRLTRANRSGSDPAVESRFWLRLMAMTGGVDAGSGPDYAALARTLDSEGQARRAARPAVHVPRDRRPTAIGVTAVDLLQKDPYSFYARHILRLDRLDPIDARTSPAWRGTRVHDLLEQWVKVDKCDPAALEARIADLAADPALDPVTHALWLPRIVPALHWAADRILADLAAGRTPLATEADGRIVIDGISVSGKADRIDRLADGRLAIVDYKTGDAPKPVDVGRGLDRQLGLLGAMAEAGGFESLAAIAVGDYEYWQLKPVRSKGLRAEIKRPYSTRSKDAVQSADALAAHAVHGFSELAARFLTGDEPFAPSTDKAALKNRDAHQLMRRDEWFGREREGDDDGEARGDG